MVAKRESEERKEQTTPFKIDELFHSSDIHVDERIPETEPDGANNVDMTRLSWTSKMRKLVWIGLALTAIGVLVRTEEEEDGGAVVAAPFLLALGIECAIFFLRGHQSRLLARHPPL